MSHLRTRVSLSPFVVVALGLIWVCFSPKGAAQNTHLETVLPPSNQGVQDFQGGPAHGSAPVTPPDKRLIRYYDEKGRKHYVNYDTFVPEQFRATAEYDVTLPPITRGEYGSAKGLTFHDSGALNAGSQPSAPVPAPAPANQNPPQNGAVKRGGDGVIAKQKLPQQLQQQDSAVPAEVADVLATASAIKQKEGIDPMDPKFIQDTLLEASRALGYQP